MSLYVCLYVLYTADQPAVKQKDTTVETQGGLDGMDVGDKGIVSSQLKKLRQDKQKKKLKRLKKKRLAKGRF